MRQQGSNGCHWQTQPDTGEFSLKKNNSMLAKQENWHEHNRACVRYVKTQRVFLK